MKPAAIDARVRQAQEFARTQAERRGESCATAKQQGQQAAQAVFEQLQKDAK